MRIILALFVALVPACNGNIGDLFSLFPASAFQPDQPDNPDGGLPGGGLTAEEVSFLAAAQGVTGDIRNIAITVQAGQSIAFLSAADVGFHIIDVTNPENLNSTNVLATIDDSVLLDAGASIAGGRVDNLGIVDNTYLVCVAVASGAANAVTVFHIPTLLSLVAASSNDYSTAFVPGTGDIAVDGTPAGNAGGVDGASGIFLVATGTDQMGAGLIASISSWQALPAVTSTDPQIDNFLDVKMAFPVAYATVASGDDVRLATLAISIVTQAVTVQGDLDVLTGGFSTMDGNNGSAPGTFVARPALDGTGNLYASGLNDVRIFSLTTPTDPIEDSIAFNAGISIGGIAAAPNALVTGDGATLRFFGVLQGIVTPLTQLQDTGRRYYDLEYSVIAAGTFVLACADSNGLRVIQIGDFSDR